MGDDFKLLSYFLEASFVLSIQRHLASLHFKPLLKYVEDISVT